MVIAQIVRVFGMTRVRKLAVAVLLVMALLSYGMMFQGSRGLWERDEGRYTNSCPTNAADRGLRCPCFQ